MTCHLFVASNSGLPPVTGICWPSTTCHWCTPGSLLQLTGVGQWPEACCLCVLVAGCNSLVQAGDQQPVNCMHRQNATCLWHMLAACRLWLV